MPLLCTPFGYTAARPFGTGRGLSAHRVPDVGRESHDGGELGRAADIVELHVPKAPAATGTRGDGASGSGGGRSSGFRAGRRVQAGLDGDVLGRWGLAATA